MAREVKQSAGQFRAVVQAVAEGKHGPYAIAEAEGLGMTPSPFEGSLTFSISEGVWSENVWPSAGEVVVLSQLRKKRSGWRALKARFLQPSDIL